MGSGRGVRGRELRAGGVAPVSARPPQKSQSNTAASASLDAPAAEEDTSRMKSLIVMMLLLPSVSLAQKSKPATSSKTVKVDFEDELIQGKEKKPDLMLLNTQSGVKFEKLIKLRENFMAELKKSAADAR